MEVDIPQRLQVPVAKALAWFNERNDSCFEVSGIVESESDLSANSPDYLEFGMVLCDGEICDKVHIRCVSDGEEFNFSLIEGRSGDIPASLDPPSGVRNRWLDKVLEKHQFVLLLFYRGLW